MPRLSEGYKDSYQQISENICTTSKTLAMTKTIKSQVDIILAVDTHSNIWS